MMLQIEHYPHDDKEAEDEHFAQVYAQALITSGIVPNMALCERWLAKDYVNEYELEMILEAYEEMTDVGS